MMDPNGRLGRQ